MKEEVMEKVLDKVKEILGFFSKEQVDDSTICLIGDSNEYESFAPISIWRKDIQKGGPNRALGRLKMELNSPGIFPSGNLETGEKELHNYNIDSAVVIFETDAVKAEKVDGEIKILEKRTAILVYMEVKDYGKRLVIFDKIFSDEDRESDFVIGMNPIKDTKFVLHTDTDIKYKISTPFGNLFD